MINDLQGGLAEKLELQAIYDLVGDRLREVFDSQVVSISILNSETGMVHFPYTVERGVRFPEQVVPLSGFTQIAMEGKQPIVINDRFAERAAEVGSGIVQGEETKSGIFVPLVVGNESTGVISLQHADREHAFSEADVRLLTTIAGSLAVALENARLFEETRQRNAELALINDVQRGLAENLDAQAMYDLVGDRIRDIFDAQRVPSDRCGDARAGRG